jgi:uncharacterized protein (DUF849 family)
MWLKACLNGSRQAGAHPALPVTPDELAADAVAVRRAGAHAVHVHPRDAQGRESLGSADIGAAVEVIRAAAPGLPVGVSTGLWIIDGDVRARQEIVRGWARLPESARPDFASCNVSEGGFRDLAVAVMDAGIDVEAGVWSQREAEAFADSGLAEQALRILIEVIDAPAEQAWPLATRILDRLDDLGLPVPRLLHGEGPAAWPLIDEAIRLVQPTRIGLEDVLHGPAGEPVSGNAELVRLALSRVGTDPGP